MHIAKTTKPTPHEGMGLESTEVMRRTACHIHLLDGALSLFTDDVWGRQKAAEQGEHHRAQRRNYE